MTAAPLCECCSKISFDALRCPSRSEIANLQRGEPAKEMLFRKMLDVDAAHRQVNLGSLGRIQRDSHRCRLCYLIWQALTRYNSDQIPYLTSKCEEIICFAETHYYGIFWNPHNGTEDYDVRRLSILTKIGGVTTGHSLYFAFQVCDNSASAVQINDNFQDPRQNVDQLVFGGRRRPLEVNLQWVRRWIELCQHSHGSACELKPGQDKLRVQVIRFIDVKKKSIASFTDIELSTIKHICLSYVWGSSQNLMLRSDNTKDLMTDGAISSKRPPKTIADGIYLTEALGFDYLWVDALCILQDDDDDKRVQIGYMHAIYQMAFMTIIAASGNNADAGLPGLWPGTRSVVPEEVIIKKATDIDPGITLLTTLSPRRDSGQNHLAQTTWNSRGWTMQERVLSRRVLAFTDEQVHFACQKAIFCEESYFENSAVPFIRFQGNAQELNLQGALRVSYESTDPADRFWRRYRALVKDFTCRRFTFDGDVYDGFLAITTALSQISEETFLWGLPRSRFEFGLWWTTFSGHIRRDSLSTLPMTSLNIKVRFPSWTWIGWVGEAWVSVGDDRWETGEAPEITCYVHYDSPLRVLKVADTVSSSHPTQVPCIEEGNTELRNQWKPDHDLTVSVEDIEIHLKNVYDKLVEIPEEHIIFFWTSLATFTLEPVSTQGNQNTAPRILDSTGKQVGTMGIMKNEYWQSGHYDRGEHEFVVIGSRRFYTFDPILAVLQIERREGIAYRVNIGEINEEDWVKAQRGWTLVALQ